MPIYDGIAMMDGNFLTKKYFILKNWIMLWQSGWVLGKFLFEMHAKACILGFFSS